MKQKHPIRSRTRRYRVTLAVAHLHSIVLAAKSRSEAEQAGLRQWVEQGSAGFRDEALAAKGKPFHIMAQADR